jgi:hypothetical protein
MYESRLLLSVVLFSLSLFSDEKHVIISQEMILNKNNLLLSTLVFELKTEDLSPVIMGILGGSIVLVISSIIIWCMCRKRTEQKQETPVKLDVINQFDVSIDISKVKLAEPIHNESPKKVNTFAKVSEQDDKESVNANPLEKSNEKEANKGNLNNSSERKLIDNKFPTPKLTPAPITPLEIKQQKITKLFENFTSKLNEKYTSEQDKYEFFKPLPMVKTQKTDAMSFISKMTANPNNNNIQDLVCYTNEKRESPTNSFYEKKIDEINQIQEIALDLEDDKTHKKIESQNPKETKKEEKQSAKKKTAQKDEEIEEEEDEVEGFKEQEATKNMLQPDQDDIISDFNEKTRNVQIEIHKKSTFELDKESMEHHKKRSKVELFHYQESLSRNKKLF